MIQQVTVRTENDRWKDNEKREGEMAGAGADSRFY